MSIKPGAYPWRNHPNAWRPAHIHFSLFGQAFEQRLVTQMYFPGDPLLPYDPIYNSVPDAGGRDRLLARLDPTNAIPEWALAYRFDIVPEGPCGDAVRVRARRLTADRVRSRTQVGIVGAGPAGLFLSHLLHLAGVDSIVIENRTREYVEHRVRAGVLEQGTVDSCAMSVSRSGWIAKGWSTTGIELRFGGHGHRIPLSDLAGGRAITIYGQQEVVKDLISARLEVGGDIRFEVDDVRIAGLDGEPSITFVHEGAEQVIDCDFVAGCDGFHGVARDAIPKGCPHGVPPRVPVRLARHPRGRGTLDR